MWKRGDIYLWIFRFTTVVVIVAWLYMLISIYGSGGEFGDQAGKCMFGTMFLFTILGVVHRWKEYM